MFLSLSSSLFFNEPGQINRISSSYPANKLPLYDFEEAIVYQVFLPAFLPRDDTDYYLRRLTYEINYFASLGVNTVELFPIEQYSCDSDVPNCWKDVSIDFPGVVHQQFGTITQLHEFVVTAHTRNIRVLLDISWALFDSKSLLYDIDCNGSWGSFFHPEASSLIGQRRRLDFNLMKQSGNFLKKIVSQWRNEAGVDGLVWLEASCLLYGGKFCREGYGSTDFDAISIIEEIRDSSDYLHVGFPSFSYRRSAILRIRSPPRCFLRCSTILCIFRFGCLPDAQHDLRAVAFLRISAQRQQGGVLPLRAEPASQERVLLRGPRHRAHSLRRRRVLHRPAPSAGAGDGSDAAGPHDPLPLHGHRVLHRAELHRGARRAGLEFPKHRGVGLGRG